MYLVDLDPAARRACDEAFGTGANRLLGEVRPLLPGGVAGRPQVQLGLVASQDGEVRFGDFQIGSKAKFLKQLEPYVSPKSGLPPVRMMRDKPGIEATYGINLGSFGVGYLSFSNVSLNAGARLPFGAREEAEFLISIGRQDAPFLISSTIFGGGGYLQLQVPRFFVVKE